MKPRYVFGPTPLRMWLNVMASRDDARVAAAKRIAY